MSSWDNKPQTWGETFQQFGVSLIKVYIPIIIVSIIFLAFITVPTLVNMFVKEELTQKTITLTINNLIKHDVPLIDGHNDLPWFLSQLIEYANEEPNLNLWNYFNSTNHYQQTDIPRLKRGDNGAIFFSVYTACSRNDSSIIPGSGFNNNANSHHVNDAITQIDFINRLFAKYSDYFVLAKSANDIRTAFINSQDPIRGRQLASLLGVEGGHMIGGDLSALRILYALGARYLTLTHGCSTNWARSASDLTHGPDSGLTDFGKSVVRQMNRLGMLVDLSHTAPETMRAALNVSLSPVIFSHSNTYDKCKSMRNVPDDVILKVKDNGGIIMVTYYPPYVKDSERLHYEALREAYPGDYKTVAEEMREWQSNATNEQRATIDDVIDHIDHIKKLTGSVDNIGLGSDFDGTSGLATRGLEDVSKVRKILERMMARGYSVEEIKKVAGTNLLRVMDRAEYVASVLQKRHVNDPLFV